MLYNLCWKGCVCWCESLRGSMSLLLCVGREGVCRSPSLVCVSVISVVCALHSGVWVSVLSMWSYSVVGSGMATCKLPSVEFGIVSND